ncbi:MAG: hypothetical protein GZ094_25015 [Mariniphaga sp.]|nr:hypothetical protein [Mariniphaga sp.]
MSKKTTRAINTTGSKEDQAKDTNQGNQYCQQRSKPETAFKKNIFHDKYFVSDNFLSRVTA